MSSDCSICLKPLRWYQRKNHYYHCTHRLHATCYEKHREHNNEGFLDEEVAEGSHYFCPLCSSLIKGKYFLHYFWNINDLEFCEETLLPSSSEIKNTKKLICEIFLDDGFCDPDFRKKFEICLRYGHLFEFKLPCRSTIKGILKGVDELHLICTDCEMIDNYVKTGQIKF